MIRLEAVAFPTPFTVAELAKGTPGIPKVACNATPGWAAIPLFNNVG